MSKQRIDQQRPTIRINPSEEVMSATIEDRSITNFETCIAAGHLMLTTDPPKCRTTNGRVFVSSGLKVVKIIKEVEIVK
jgi:hypothetical protein